MKKNVICIIFICIIILLITANKVQALSLTDIWDSGNRFLNKANSSPIDPNGIQGLIGSLFNIFVGLGIIIAVVMTSILGIKFILASPGEKAEIKEILIPFVIGTIVILGAFGIWKIATNVIQDFI